MEHQTHIHTWITGDKNERGEYSKECTNCKVTFKMDKNNIIVGVIDRRQHGRRQGDGRD